MFAGYVDLCMIFDVFSGCELCFLDVRQMFDVKFARYLTYVEIKSNLL